MTIVKVIASEDSLKPTKGSEEAGGFDLRFSTDVVIPRGAELKVGTGLKFEIPVGHIGLVLPRSGIQKGLSIANGVGLIDSDYRGEIFLRVVNNTNDTFLAYKGDRYFQLAIVPVLLSKLQYVNIFETPTARGSKGFNSSGLT